MDQLFCKTKAQELAELYSTKQAQRHQRLGY